MAKREAEGGTEGDVNRDGARDFRDAVLQAEYSTGRVETTETQAWHQIFVRLARITVGFLMLFAGLAMVVLPGPALVVIPASLAILAKDFAWAERALLYAQKKAIQAKDQATGRNGTIVLIVAAVAIFAFGIWYWQTSQDFGCWPLVPDRFSCAS